ncbi:MAG: ribbon-helix-helix protein, CopG family [Thermoanaerobaculia bacterium]
MRISARLDQNRSQKLDFLANATHLGTSEIVKRAIDVYYDQVHEARPRPAEILERSGFVGCGEADPELSERYKERVAELLATKHGHR